jgi:hypothetical protein
MVATNKPFARASHFNRTVVASLLCVAMLTGLTVACGDDDDADDKTAGSADTRGAGGSTDELTSPAIDGPDTAGGTTTGAPMTADTTTGDDATDGSAFADTNGPSPTDATAADTGDATGTTDTADTGGAGCTEATPVSDPPQPGFVPGLDETVRTDCPATPSTASFFVETADGTRGEWTHAYVVPHRLGGDNFEFLEIYLFDEGAVHGVEQGVYMLIGWADWTASAGPLSFDFGTFGEPNGWASTIVYEGALCITGPCRQFGLVDVGGATGTLTFPRGGPLPDCSVIEFSVNVTFTGGATYCSQPVTLRGTASVPLLPANHWAGLYQ